jgi:hypothetical protein
VCARVRQMPGIDQPPNMQTLAVWLLLLLLLWLF